MTKEQKEKLHLHVALNRPINRSQNEDWVCRTLDNEETIEFTNCKNTSNNSEYEINNNPSRKIWFSQLSRYYLTDDLEGIYQPTVVFKDGREYILNELDSCVFYNMCKGRKFQVEKVPECIYALNEKSETIKAKYLSTLLDTYNFVKNCVDTNKFNEIGDILKLVTAARLIEIDA